MRRWTRDERGLAPVPAVILAFVLVAGFASAWGFKVFVLDENLGPQNRSAASGPTVDDTIYTNPPDCPAAREFASGRGLVYTDKGWRFAGDPAPTFDGDVRKFKSAFAEYRGGVLAQVTADSFVEDMKKACTQQQDLEPAKPVPAPVVEQPPDIPGTYRYDHDEQGSTSAQECTNSITQLRVSVAVPTITIVATGSETLTFTGTLSEYSFSARATTTDGTEIGTLTGRFARIGDETQIRDGTRTVSVGGGCTYRYGGTRIGS